MQKIVSQRYCLLNGLSTHESKSAIMPNILDEAQPRSLRNAAMTSDSEGNDDPAI